MKRISFDRVVAIAAFAAGIIALYLSWDANNISRQQASPRLIVLVTERLGAPIIGSSAPADAPHLSVYECLYRVRVTNLGGAATSIIGYDTTVRYQDSTVVMSSNDPSAYTNQSIQSRIGGFLSSLAKERLIGKGCIPEHDPYPTECLEELPSTIDAYSTRDFYPRLRTQITGSSVLSAYLPDPGKSDYQELMSNYKPLTVEYAFRLASGQVLEVPPMVCVYPSERYSLQ